MNKIGHPLIKAEGIKKTFNIGTDSIEILHGLNLELYKGESLAIVGGSGAGKSTFLHIIGTLEKPTAGTIFYDGQEIKDWNDQNLSFFRNRNLGFVFQSHYLLNEFSALDNVALPCLISGQSQEEAKTKASQLLFKLGLADRVDHFPNQLSGGEQQRVAVARALIMEPQVILADEPTGNLDKKNSKIIEELFCSVVEDFKVGLIVVTHDLNFARAFSRQKAMKDGLWEH